MNGNGNDDFNPPLNTNAPIEDNQRPPLNQNVFLPSLNSSDSSKDDHPRPPLFFVQDDDKLSDDFYPKEGDILPELKNKYNKQSSNQKNDYALFDQNIDSIQNYFSLSALGLTNVSQLPIVDDFTFVVGGKEYHTNRFLASYISPVITRVLISDVNADKFVIGIEDEEGYFKSIMSLLKGNVIQIKDENILFLMEIAKIFENDEMIEAFSTLIPTLHEGNAIDLFLQRRKYNLETSQEVQFIAENFLKIPVEQLKELNPEQLADIVGNESLMVKDEDSFFQFLYDYIKLKGEDSTFLLGYVNLAYLNEDFIPLYIQMVTPETINGMIWESICSRLQLEVNLKKKKRKKGKYDIDIDLDKEKDKMFDGILNRLRTKPNFKKNVKITASSFKTDNMYILTDRSQEGYWSSYNLPNSWIKFYFKTKSIKLEEYSLETADLASGKGHMISWVLEASNDDINWYTLDTQYNYCLHEGYTAASTFPCDKSGFYKMFRIKQCGLNDKGDDTMILKAVEFFGRVKSLT